VVLAAPQMKCNEEMIRETCEEHGKKYAIIDNYAFATLDGTKCFELAKNLI
jgi:PTS system cellobiose-specific IIB component